jgi:small subunit ribosomal protein S19e
MTTSFDVDKNTLIERVAVELKKNNNIKAPEWATWVKTGVHKERPPMDHDWWFSRAAAVLVRINEVGPIGVSKLRTKYGGKKRRGHKPPHSMKGSGNIIRKVLQQLEKAGLIKQTDIKGRKGRVIMPAGRSLLDKTATDIYGRSPKKAERAEPKAEAPKVVAEPKPEAKKPKRGEKIEVTEKITDETIKKTEKIVEKAKDG